MYNPHTGVKMEEYIDDKINEINRGLKTAYIDSSYNSNLAYRPEFVSNNYKQGKKVLSSIEDELNNCDEFCISVAFITMSGITPLLQTLKELEEKNIPGKILTTDYLMFSEPTALEKLSNLKNIQLKMFCTNKEIGGFHTKGYIFRKEEIYKIIIGSSNMTLNAITKNREWNTKIVSTEDGEVTKDILNEFESLWEDEHSLDYKEFIEQYKTNYEIVKEQQRIAKSQKIASIEQYKLKPNKMQVEFIRNLRKLREKGVKKALLLSSTGTGKTYASAYQKMKHFQLTYFLEY
jgi:HKD family nuclease